MFITRYDLETTLNRDDILKLAELDSEYKIAVGKAISVVKSYIQHRYNPDEIFIDALSYSATVTYAVDDLIFYNKKYYVCILESLNHLPTDTDYFTESDSRDPSIVDIVCVLTIFILFRKIQPRNMPDWITEEYDRKVDELKAYQRGTRTIELTVKLDEDDEEEGHRVTYGSETQKDWNF